MLANKAFGPLGRLGKSRSKMLQASTAALAATVMVGGFSALDNRKDVTVLVDGEQVQLVTYSRDVATALDEADVEYGENDLVEPAPEAQVSAGDTITINRTRPVTIDLDGEKFSEWTTALTVSELVASRDDIPAGSYLSPAIDAELPSTGTEIRVVTPVRAMLADGGAEPTAVAAPGRTVGEFLQRAGVALGEDDVVEPAVETPIGPDTVITVTRILAETITEREQFEVPELTEEDGEAERGERTTAEPGRPGEKDVSYRVVRVNGVETERVRTGEEIVSEAVPAVVRVGTRAPAPAPSRPGPAVQNIAGNSVWDTLAQCESNGNWSIDTGNGFSGGLQFHPQTWAGYGGTAFAPTAAQATREQQIAIAEKVQASQGWGAWPACTARMGLR